jgi:hypothetical protein
MQFLRCILSFLSAEAVLASLVGDAHPGIFGDNDDTKSRVIIQFKTGQKVALAKSLGFGSVSALNTTSSAAGNEVHYQFDKLNAFAVSVPTTALEDLRNDPIILSIEDDPRRYLTGMAKSNTGLLRSRRGQATNSQSVPYGVDMVEARDVWDVNRDGIVDLGAHWFQP